MIGMASMASVGRLGAVSGSATSHNMQHIPSGGQSLNAPSGHKVVHSLRRHETAASEVKGSSSHYSGKRGGLLVSQSEPACGSESMQDCLLHGCFSICCGCPYDESPTIFVYSIKQGP